MNQLIALLAQTPQEASSSSASQSSMLTSDRIATLAIGAVLTLVIREVWGYVKSRRATRARWRTLVTVARDEIAFNLGKLEQLEKELGKFVKTLTGQGGQHAFIPSYTVYPEFLEHQRRLIAEHGLSGSETVKNLGHCAFELRHIAKRIADARTSGQPTISASDWQGTHGLVSTNVKTFQGVLEELSAQL